MTKETEFARIKRAVEAERTKKMQGEARMESLEREEKRMFAEATELTGETFNTAEEIETFATKLREKIENNISEMKEILDAEGVVY